MSMYDSKLLTHTHTHVHTHQLHGQNLCKETWCASLQLMRGRFKIPSTIKLGSYTTFHVASAIIICSLQHNTLSK